MFFGVLGPPRDGAQSDEGESVLREFLRCCERIPEDMGLDGSLLSLSPTFDRESGELSGVRVEVA
jgi:hypothetical protein